MKTVQSQLLIIALSAFAIMGAPCPGLNGQEDECEDDDDCDDDEECNDGECEEADDGNGNFDAQAMEFCVRSYECQQVEDPEGTCQAEMDEYENDPESECILAACGSETGALYECALANGECVDGYYDAGFGAGGACEDPVQSYMDCYNESECVEPGEGEGEGEGEGVCAGYIGAGDGCDCGCGEHDPDCDSVGGGCDASGCCQDPPQNGCQYCN